MATDTRRPHRYRRLLITGLLAVVAAMIATTLAAAIAKALGVDFQLPNAAEPIPLAGFAVVTGLFCLLGVLLAVALLRWTANPARRFLQTTTTLTTLSLIAPLVSGADTGTITGLIALHLVAAAVMIPTVTRRLAASSGDAS